MGAVQPGYETVAGVGDVRASPPRKVLLIYDTYELHWDCCNLYRRFIDRDWDHHAIFLREKGALRKIGAVLQAKLGKHNFVFSEMTLEEDLRMSAIIPP